MCYSYRVQRSGTPWAHRPEGLCFPYQSNVNFGFLGLLLVFAQRWVNFFAPCIQAAFEINQILEAFAAQKRDRARAADARLAHHDGRFCPWNFCQSLRNRAKRNQLRVWNTRDLKLEWLAHVDQCDLLATSYHFVQLGGGNPSNF